MKNFNKFLILAASVCSLGFASCINDLDVEPIDPNVTMPEDVLDSEEAFTRLLAKCYTGLAASGGFGKDGGCDLSGIDGGFSQYVRLLFVMQCLTTDEATCCWNDPGLPDMHAHTWNSSNSFVNGAYYRFYTQIGFCNEFIRKANETELSAEEFPSKGRLIAEARALRALTYYHVVDLFGNASFVSEHSIVGANPDYISRADLFNYVVDECKALLEGNDIPEAGQAGYARLDKSFVRMVLAKMYLNAEVYVGKAMYAEAATLCKQIMSDHPLHTVAVNSNNKPYAELFMADNHQFYGKELIFVVPQDAQKLTSWGVTNYLIYAGCGASTDSPDENYMDPSKLGISSGWGGLSLTYEFSDKFDLVNDYRAMFHTKYGQSIDDIYSFLSEDPSKLQTGYKSMKYSNMKSDGTAGSSTEGGRVDTDYPLFRSADAFLMLAECAARGAADEAEGLNALNAIRTRANLPELSTYDLDIVLDERARELFWECGRRTDLIRFGKFNVGYSWQWKGGVKEGKDTETFRALMPIPSSELNANSNLKQNAGY